MMGDSRMEIKCFDEKDLDVLYNEVIKDAMKRGLTGHVTLYMLDGVIKGFEVNASMRSIGKWSSFLKRERG